MSAAFHGGTDQLVDSCADQLAASRADQITDSHNDQLADSIADQLIGSRTVQVTARDLFLDAHLGGIWATTPESQWHIKDI